MTSKNGISEAPMKSRDARITRYTAEFSSVAEFEIDQHPEQLMALLNLHDLPADPAELVNRAADAYNDAGKQFARAGFMLLEAKRRCPHGQFGTLVRATGMSEDTAGRAMNMARFLLRMPVEHRARLTSLPPYKAMELVKLDPEVIDEIVESGTFDEIETLSVRELRARLRERASENLRLKERLELSAKMAKDLSRLEANEAVPLFAREVREEAMFVSETMLISLQALEDTADASLFGEVKHPERLRWQPASARTLYHALATPVARALALMERAKAAMGDDSDTALVLDSQLEPSELKRFETMREALLQRLQAEKQDRDDERANTQPGRRGRRRGSKG